MNKVDFVLELNERLNGLPKEDIEKSIDYYTEMIDDRIEDGASEEEAVSAVGNIDEIVKQIISDIPFAKIVKEISIPKKKLSAWVIILLILGSPVWLSLGIAAFAVILSLYVSLWVVIISLWAVFASFVGCFVGGVLACVIFATSGNVASGLVMLAAGIVCAGLSIFMFYGCKVATKGTLTLTKKMAIWIKSCFIKKEVA